MTTLFVLQFLTMLWIAALTVWFAFLIHHTRDTRRAVLAAFKGQPNDLRLPPHPLPAPVAAMLSRPEAGPPPSEARPLAAGTVRGPDDLVAPAPTVGGDTVRDYLRHFTHRDFVWDDVVSAFYQRVADDPVIAPCFTGVDLDRLQRHFVATLVMVTNTGLTARAVRAMTLAHGNVRTPEGMPITGVVYDRVVGHLAAVLAEHGVPQPAIERLAAVLDPLRAAIVVVDRPSIPEF